MAEITTDKTVEMLIKKRPQDSHKGSFGTLQLFCGSKNMPGAPFFAATGALRCGVGLVYISARGKLKHLLMQKLSEPVFTGMKISPRATAFVVGCGSARNARYVKKLLLQTKPVVIDADAITYLSKRREIIAKKKCTAVLTPHPLEMSRLTGLSVDEIQRDREKSAVDAAKRYDCIIVLKGHKTVVASSDGRVSVNSTGNSGLAKGGSGDVLAGMTGAFLAQGYDAYSAAQIAVWLHGKAADSLKNVNSEYGILPSDIPAEAGKLLKMFE